MNEGKVGEAVFVRLGANEEVDVLAFFVESVVVRFALGVARCGDDLADVTESKGVGGEFFDHVVCRLVC